MKIVVTGAGGFLGAAVCAAAASAGHEVVATARQAEPERLRPLADTIRGAVLDISDTPAVERLFDEVRPHIVVHSAWAGLMRTQRDGPEQLAQLGAWCRLAQAAGDAGVRKLVGIGSQAEYGATIGRTDEGMLPNPNSMYGAAKLSAGVIGGRIAANADIEFAWLRLFAIYGPGDNPRWLIPAMLATLARSERPRLTAGTQRMDYLYVDDAASAVLAVATGRASGVFNLSSGEALTVRAIVERLRDLVCPDMALKFGEVPFARGQPMHIEGANDRLCAATGWRPATSLDAGLARTARAAN